MIPNKNRIQQRFTRATATYDRQAVIQQRVADRLIQLLDENLEAQPDRILEIGSCTGLLTGRLARKFNNFSALFVNDLVPDFETTVMERVLHNPKCRYIAGDIEKIDLPTELELIVSSSTFHWLEDFPALVKKLQEQMKGGGTLAFSMYSTDNLQELREVTGIGLHYYSLEEISKIVAQYFTVAAADEERVTFRFPDPLELLHHLRETGVNSLDGTTWNRSRLNSFISRYQNRFNDEGRVKVTYHPAYIIARKEK